MADPGVQAFLDFWHSLPPDYVPQSSFAYTPEGLYAYPATPYEQAAYQARATGTPNWAAGRDPAEFGPVVTEQALLTGQVPGAEALQGTIDPKYAEDLANFYRQIQAGNATDDSFQGFIANVFGNSFTLPALFASAAMGANAWSGIGTTPADVGQAADLVGGTGTETALGSAAGDTLASGDIPISSLAPEVSAETLGTTTPATNGGLLGTGLLGGTGVLGSGLTPAQLAKLGLAGTSLATGLAGASGGGTPEVSGDVAPLPDQEALFQRLRQLGLTTMREREALAGESAIRQTAQANASPMELLESVRPAISQIRDKLRAAFKTASGQLGPGGGGQVERAEQRALANAGSLLQTLFAAQPAGGLTGLTKSLTSFKPALFTNLQEPVTTRKSVPGQFGDFAGAAKGYKNLSTLIDQTFDTSANDRTAAALGGTYAGESPFGSDIGDMTTDWSKVFGVA